MLAMTINYLLTRINTIARKDIKLQQQFFSTIVRKDIKLLMTRTCAIHHVLSHQHRIGSNWPTPSFRIWSIRHAGMFSRTSYKHVRNVTQNNWLEFCQCFLHYREVKRVRAYDRNNSVVTQHEWFSPKHTKTTVCNDPKLMSVPQHDW